jgi:hypothetical protein
LNDEQHAVGNQLDVSSQGESWVGSAGYNKAPHQSNEYEHQAVDEKLSTAAGNAHESSLIFIDPRLLELTVWIDHLVIIAAVLNQ